MNKWITARSLLMALAVGVTCLGATCGDTGLERIEVKLEGQGTEEATTFEAGDWTVTLTRADVAFGPAYFCATTAADVDLCPIAVAEFLDAATIDALDGDVQALGPMVSSTNTVRSTTFDYGIPWLFTAQKPRALDAAPGGHSARFEGSAVRGGDAFDFTLDLDVVSANAGDIAIRGLQTKHAITAQTDALRVKMDPAAWWKGVEFDDLFVEAEEHPGEVLEIDTAGATAGVVRTGMSTRALPAFDWFDADN